MTRQPRRTGFTMIEVLVAVTIVTVLAVVTIPRMTGQSRKAQVAEAMMVSSAIAKAQMRYAYQHGALTTDLSQRDITIDTSKTFPGGSYYA